MKELTRRDFLKLTGLAIAGALASQIPIKGVLPSVANPATVITKPTMGAGTFHVLGSVYWHYSESPVGGGLTIKDGSTTVFSMEITNAGAGFLPFMPSLRISDNSALVVALADGGDGVTGKLSLNSWISDHLFIGENAGKDCDDYTIYWRARTDNRAKSRCAN